jgi:hypothetical protein
MITNTAPVTSGIPAQTSILGIVSSPDSTSSFADQLESAVSQAGSDPQPGGGNPMNIGGTQRQNSDAPAAPPANAPASPTVQYSFFQYLMGTPSATETPAPSAKASPIAPPVAIDSPSETGMMVSSKVDPQWLSPPYYTPPAATFVSWENPPGVINTTASPESDLQNLAAQFINDPLQFGWGSVPATTPQEFIDNIVSYAQLRAAMYPKTCPEGYDPVAMGTKYANLVMDSIKKIQYDTVGTSQYASVYDAWVAGVNTWPGASGATSVS